MSSQRQTAFGLSVPWRPPLFELSSRVEWIPSHTPGGGSKITRPTQVCRGRPVLDVSNILTIIFVFLISKPHKDTTESTGYGLSGTVRRASPSARCPPLLRQDTALVTRTVRRSDRDVAHLTKLSAMIEGRILDTGCGFLSHRKFNKTQKKLPLSVI